MTTIANHVAATHGTTTREEEVVSSGYLAKQNERPSVQEGCRVEEAGYKGPSVVHFHQKNCTKIE